MNDDPRLARPNRWPAVIVILALVGAAFGAHYLTGLRDDRREAFKGAALRLQLKAMRLALVKYEGRHHVYPHTLADLVTDGDIHAIPVDPVTGSPSSWRTTTEQRVQVDDFRVGSTATVTTIIDVHSGAPGTDQKGKAWGDY